jgi:hypothetical protein
MHLLVDEHVQPQERKKAEVGGHRGLRGGGGVQLVPYDPKVLGESLLGTRLPGNQHIYAPQ